MVHRNGLNRIGMESMILLELWHAILDRGSLRCDGFGTDTLIKGIMGIRKMKQG